MIKKIGKITIYVNNQEEAKAFWTEKLNFVIKLEQPMGPNMTWLEVGPNECEFTTFILYDKKMMLAQKPSANVGHPNVILSTDNIEESYNELKEKGVEVSEIMTMPYGKMFSFKDQDGNDYLLREGSTMNNSNVERNLEIIDAFNEIIKDKKYKKYFDIIEFLAIDHIYISAIVRVINAKTDKQKKLEVINKLINYMNNNFSNFRNNKYIEVLSRNRKIIYELINRKMYGLIKLIFKIKKG